MGVLFDYFRAPDVAAALRAAKLAGGPLDEGDEGESAFDGVDAKGVDPTVILGQLVAFARGVRWTPETVRTTSVWPDTLPHGIDGDNPPPEDSPWATGPWIEEIDDATRDTLADVASDRYGDLAAQWARIEEFAIYSALDGALPPLIAELSGLARRARDAGDRLYCWSCL